MAGFKTNDQLLHRGEMDGVTCPRCWLRKFRPFDCISVLACWPKIAGRRYLAIELDAAYCDVAVRHWETAIG